MVDQHLASMTPGCYEAQRDFLKRLTGEESVIIAQFLFATGKTFTLVQAARIFKKAGYKVLACSPTNKNAHSVAAHLLKAGLSVDVSLLDDRAPALSDNRPQQSRDCIMSTLDGVAKADFQKKFGQPRVLLVDEAEGASLGELLPAMSLLGSHAKVLLFGDKRQRAPVILGKGLRRSALNRGAISAFEAAGAHSTVFNVQSRVPANLASALVRRHYGFEVVNKKVSLKVAIKVVTPVAKLERWRSGSCCNVGEAQAAVEHFLSNRALIEKEFAGLGPHDPLAIFACVYDAQVSCVLDVLERLKVSGRERVVVTTVKAIQGDQAPYVAVLTSTSRSPTPFSISERDANVAMSRTMRALYISATGRWLASSPAGRAIFDIMPELDSMRMPLGPEILLRRVQELRNAAPVLATRSIRDCQELCKKVVGGDSIICSERVSQYDHYGAAFHFVSDAISGAASELQALSYEAQETEGALARLERHADGFFKGLCGKDSGPTSLRNSISIGNIAAFTWPECLPPTKLFRAQFTSRQLLERWAEHHSAKVVDMLSEIVEVGTFPVLWAPKEGLPLLPNQALSLAAGHDTLNAAYHLAWRATHALVFLRIPFSSTLDVRTFIWFGPRPQTKFEMLELQTGTFEEFRGSLHAARTARVQQAEEARKEVYRSLASMTLKRADRLPRDETARLLETELGLSRDDPMYQAVLMRSEIASTQLSALQAIGVPELSRVQRYRSEIAEFADVLQKGLPIAGVEPDLDGFYPVSVLRSKFRFCEPLIRRFPIITKHSGRNQMARLEHGHRTRVNHSGVLREVEHIPIVAWHGTDQLRLHSIMTTGLSSMTRDSIYVSLVPPPHWKVTGKGPGRPHTASLQINLRDAVPALGLKVYSLSGKAVLIQGPYFKLVIPPMYLKPLWLDSAQKIVLEQGPTSHQASSAQRMDADPPMSDMAQNSSASIDCLAEVPEPQYLSDSEACKVRKESLREVNRNAVDGVELFNVASKVLPPWITSLNSPIDLNHIDETSSDQLGERALLIIFASTGDRPERVSESISTYPTLARKVRVLNVSEQDNAKATQLVSDSIDQFLDDHQRGVIHLSKPWSGSTMMSALEFIDDLLKLKLRQDRCEPAVEVTRLQVAATLQQARSSSVFNKLGQNITSAEDFVARGLEASKAFKRRGWTPATAHAEVYEEPLTIGQDQLVTELIKICGPRSIKAQQQGALDSGLVLFDSVDLLWPRGPLELSLQGIGH